MPALKMEAVCSLEYWYPPPKLHGVTVQRITTMLCLCEELGVLCVSVLVAWNDDSCSEHCTRITSRLVHVHKVSSVPVYMVLTAPVVIEGADHGRTFVRNSCGKPCSRWGLRVPRILSKLWDPVHEPGKYPLNPQQFPVCAAAMFLPCRAVKVSTCLPLHFSQYQRLCSVRWYGD